MSATPQNLFNNIYENDYFGFRTDHETDYRKVASFLDFDHNTLSKLAGVSKRSVRYDSKIPIELKERLDEILNIVLLVAGYFSGDPEKTSLWFRCKNPMLGDISPRDMIRFGRFGKLQQFVLEAREAALGVKENEPQKEG